MEKQHLMIDGIPALLWGPRRDQVFIAVHGDQSNKADDVMAIFAEEAMGKAYQTLSFDLPEHGERKHEPRPCHVKNCVEDLERVLRYACKISEHVSLFGCSVGAYYSMLAYRESPIRQALFLSPVVDMKRMVHNMMRWFELSEERLKREQKISTPAKTLCWDDYQYVLAHPVQWDHERTSLLYGEDDDLCERDTVDSFVACAHADVTVLHGGEHYFHTDAQLAFLRRWLQNTIMEWPAPSLK